MVYVSFQHIILFQTLPVLFLIGGRDNCSFRKFIVYQTDLLMWSLQMGFGNENIKQ